MTEAKPLTADEIAVKRRKIECDVCETRAGLNQMISAQRATIEQQAEQIEKLREALFKQRTCFSGDARATILRILSDAEYDQWMGADKRSDEALAATEPPK